MIIEMKYLNQDILNSVDMYRIYWVRYKIMVLYFKLKPSST